MRRECRECFLCHWLQRKPLGKDPGMHHGTCVTHVPWCMSGSLFSRGRENVPGIPGACATRNFTYLARGPWLVACLKQISVNIESKYHSIYSIKCIWKRRLQNGRHPVSPRPRWRGFYGALTQQHFVEFRYVTLDRMSRYTDVTYASRRLRPKENSIICLNHNGVETRGCVLSVVATYLGAKTQGHPYLLCWLHINCNRQFAYKSVIPSSSQQSLPTFPSHFYIFIQNIQHHNDRNLGHDNTWQNHGVKRPHSWAFYRKQWWAFCSGGILFFFFLNKHTSVHSSHFNPLYAKLFRRNINI